MEPSPSNATVALSPSSSTVATQLLGCLGQRVKIWSRTVTEAQQQREIDGVDLAWVRGAIHTCTASERAVLLGSAMSPCWLRQSNRSSASCPWCPCAWATLGHLFWHCPGTPFDFHYIFAAKICLAAFVAIFACCASSSSSFSVAAPVLVWRNTTFAWRGVLGVGRNGLRLVVTSFVLSTPLPLFHLLVLHLLLGSVLWRG